MQNCQILLKTARQAIETFVKTKKVIKPPEYPEEFKEKRGVFVTIYKHIPINGIATGSSKSLRGCIGLPYPVKPLIEALIEAAVSACCDPRFPPLHPSELKDTSIEISVLTWPKLVDASGKDCLKQIEIGKDGLIIKKDASAGLLLPQVATEHSMDAKEFLENLCYKAGLPKNAWLEGAEIYKFQAEVLKEK